MNLRPAHADVASTDASTLRRLCLWWQVLLVEHGKQYKNDVGVLRKLAREQAVVRAEAGAALRAAEVTSPSYSAVKTDADTDMKGEVAVKHEVAVKKEVA